VPAKITKLIGLRILLILSPFNLVTFGLVFVTFMDNYNSFVKEPSINDVTVLGEASEICDMPYDFWEVPKEKP
jgi:hypothetical protein